MTKQTDQVKMNRWNRLNKGQQFLIIIILCVVALWSVTLVAIWGLERDNTRRYRVENYDRFKTNIQMFQRARLESDGFFRNVNTSLQILPVLEAYSSADFYAVKREPGFTIAKDTYVFELDTPPHRYYNRLLGLVMANNNYSELVHYFPSSDMYLVLTENGHYQALCHGDEELRMLVDLQGGFVDLNDGDIVLANATQYASSPLYVIRRFSESYLLCGMSRETVNSTLLLDNAGRSYATEQMACVLDNGQRILRDDAPMPGGEATLTGTEYIEVTDEHTIMRFHLEEDTMKKLFALALCALLVMMCAAASADYAFATHHIGSTVHPYQKGAEFWNEKLQEYSGGTLSLDIYPANQLAAGSKAVEGNALGTIDICIENPMSVSNIVPAFDALNLPYMFDSAEQAFAMMKTEECKVFADECEKYNLKLLGYWYNGWRNVSNSKRPIEKVEDLKGLTIRIAESQVFADMMNALGMNAVPPANSEVFTALQMGTVDAQENPQNNYINNKYFEVNRYFSMTRHVFTVEPVTMNLDLWNSLTAEEQEAVQKSFDEAADYQIALAQETEENQLNKVLSEGADIVVTYIDDLTPFKEAVAPVIEKYKGTDLRPYIEALQAAQAKVSE